MVCTQILPVLFPILCECKFGLSSMLFHQWFCLFLAFSKFHIEHKKLKKIVSKIAFPQKFIEKAFLNWIFQHKPKVTTVLKK